MALNPNPAAKAEQKTENLPAAPAKDDNRSLLTVGEGESKMTFRAKRRVILPLLKLPEHASCAIRVESKIYLGKEIKQTAGGGQKMAAAHLWNVIDYSDGSEKQMIVPAVLKSSIFETYLRDKNGKPVKPDENGNYTGDYDSDDFRHEYVGKSFAIRNHGKPQGKRYNTYEVIEIEQV